MSNLHFAIYSKTGALLYGPVANNTLWSGFGGDCQTDNDGDPIVLYDQDADRWILTQFTASAALLQLCRDLDHARSAREPTTATPFRRAPTSPTTPSTASGPMPTTSAPASSTGPFVGVGAYAVNREEMIAGNPNPTDDLVPGAAHRHRSGQNVGDGLLPSDLDGWTAPPTGSPNYLCRHHGQQPRGDAGRHHPVEVPRRLRHPGQLDFHPRSHDPHRSRSTRHFRVRPVRGTASRSRAPRTRSTFSPTAVGPCIGSPTATSAPTSRW